MLNLNADTVAAVAIPSRPARTATTVTTAAPTWKTPILPAPLERLEHEVRDREWSGARSSLERPSKRRVNVRLRATLARGGKACPERRSSQVQPSL